MNKKTQTSRATSNFNAYIQQRSEASSSEEKDIRMRKCRRKINAKITNEEVKRSNGDHKISIKEEECRIN